MGVTLGEFCSPFSAPNPKWSGTDDRGRRRRRRRSQAKNEENAFTPDTHTTYYVHVGTPHHDTAELLTEKPNSKFYSRFSREWRDEAFSHWTKLAFLFIFFPPNLLLGMNGLNRNSCYSECGVICRVKSRSFAVLASLDAPRRLRGMNCCRCERVNRMKGGRRRKEPEKER